MPQTIKYAETTVDKIISLLRDGSASLRGHFKSFYYGDPLKIPNSSLPAVVVELMRTDVEHGATGMDEIIETVRIILMYNKQDDFGKTDKEATAIRSLEEFSQGIDPTSSLYDANSILGIIRKQFTLDHYIVDQKISIEYEPGIRPDDQLTGEARITMRMRRLIEVNDRT